MFKLIMRMRGTKSPEASKFWDEDEYIKALENVYETAMMESQFGTALDALAMIGRAVGHTSD